MASLFGEPPTNPTDRASQIFGDSEATKKAGKRKAAEPPAAKPAKPAKLTAKPAAAEPPSQPPQPKEPEPDSYSDSDSDSDDMPASRWSAAQNRRSSAEIKKALASAPELADARRAEAEAKKRAKAAAEPTEEQAAAAAERLARTIFVGNVPTSVGVKELKKFFSAHGGVESVRIRSAAAANLKMPQRGAVITGQLDTEVKDATNAYVVFRAVDSSGGKNHGLSGAQAVERALGTNGALAFGRHLAVDRATAAGQGSKAHASHDPKKSVFVGNLPFDAQEEPLWAAFGACGEVAYVRLIREPRTQQGKGFGYVGFVEEGSVERALRLHGTRLAAGGAAGGAAKKGGAEGAEAAEKTAGAGRELRVFRCSAAKGRASEVEQARAGAKVSAAQLGGAGAGKKQHAGGAGWQDRQKRRLLKKEKGKAAARLAAAGARPGRVALGGGAIGKKAHLGGGGRKGGKHGGKAAHKTGGGGAKKGGKGKKGKAGKH
jgi:nucleolar protein 12